jgi:molybdate transport system ATP-binding protein
MSRCPALDAPTRLEVRAEQRRHLAEFAGPTLIVTHDPHIGLMIAGHNGVDRDTNWPYSTAELAVRRPPAGSADCTPCSAIWWHH